MMVKKNEQFSCNYKKLAGLLHNREQSLILEGTDDVNHEFANQWWHHPQEQNTGGQGVGD
jgi:hypothetical protein|tara:strand:- start:9147 stop:9326 length:180 start_codon:yes stop_codon:yes gene_type:complete